MDIDQQQKQLALQKARELIEEGEKQRAQARLSRLIEDFLSGNGKVLLQDEFIQNLSQMIGGDSWDQSPELAAKLVENLENHACGEDCQLRERAVMALSLCGGLLSFEQHYDLLMQITHAQAHWLKVETTYFPVCDTVCRQLLRNGLKMMTQAQWQQFEPFIELISQIQSGVLKKGNVIHGLVARTQDALAADHILEELVLECLHGQGDRQSMLERILTRLGRRAVIFLLEKLLISQQKIERLYLIKLIHQTEKVAVPVLKEYLNKDLPWYGVRNIVLLIAAMGDPALVPMVLPFLKHADIRVQQQVVECIDSAGGADKRSCLLSALVLVNDSLKVDLVVRLGKLGCDAHCAEVLLDILVDRASIASDIRDELLGKICLVLRLTPQKRAIILIRELLAERARGGEAGEASDPVTKIARNTLQIIESQLQPAARKGVGSAEKNAHARKKEAGQPAGPHRLSLDGQIQQMMKDNKIAEVTTLIAEHAVHAAKAKDFETAENLRDRMLEVNPNALIEAVRLGGVIEEEKSNAISSHHLSLWRDLYDHLDSESFAALYHCQKIKEYQPEEMLVQQGDSNPALFFINEGLVSLTCMKGHSEIFLKRLTPGAIVGVGPFFDVSIWTVTLTAMSAVKVQVLERASFQKLLLKYPGLEAKLMDFCRQMEKTAELVQLSGQDRRENVRYPAEFIISNCMQDEKGNLTAQRFRGEVDDLSLGGLSLMIRISRKENARLMLGKRIISLLPAEAGKVHECRGMIVCVTIVDYVDQDYLVHVRFDVSLSEVDLKNIMFQWRR
jgi:CRP-like cAMP-binding protein